MGLWIASVALYYAVCLATSPRGKHTIDMLLLYGLVAAALIGLFLVLCARVAQGRSVGAAMAWMVGYAGLGTMAVVGAMAALTTYSNAPLVAASWGVQVLAVVWAIPALQRARPTDVSA